MVASRLPCRLVDCVPDGDSCPPIIWWLALILGFAYLTSKFTRFSNLIFPDFRQLIALAAITRKVRRMRQKLIWAAFWAAGRRRRHNRRSRYRSRPHQIFLDPREKPAARKKTPSADPKAAGRKARRRSNQRLALKAAGATIVRTLSIVLPFFTPPSWHLDPKRSNLLVILSLCARCTRARTRVVAPTRVLVNVCRIVLNTVSPPTMSAEAHTSALSINYVKWAPTDIRIPYV